MNKTQLTAAWAMVITAIFISDYGNLCYPEQEQRFQFEDYKWGMPMDVVKEEIKCPYEVYDDYSFVTYKTKVFDECEVSLYFTRKTKLLYGIDIEWYLGHIGWLTLEKERFKTLTEKYGKPTKISYNYENHVIYLWKKGNETLEFIPISENRVHYQNTDLSIQDDKEVEEVKQSKINKEDAKKF